MICRINKRMCRKKYCLYAGEYYSYSLVILLIHFSLL